MKGKKLVSLILSTVLAFSLVGCGDKKEDGPYKAKMPTGVEKAEIYVEPIEGISDDFIRGVDISSIISEEQSGVKYYNEAGEEEDIFKILADAGVNYIRVRVWNDPYNKQDMGYGGGTNDTAKAAEIGKRAAEYGMKLLVDYHYSDFWADPGKQKSPKDWAHKTYADKVQACYDFTYESLKTIIDAGADVGMVQVGNETNNGMAGETDFTRIAELMNQGSKAIRQLATEYNKDIQVAVHYTNISDYNGIDGVLKKLEEHQVDYDIFGISYYIFWHGTFENLEAVMRNVVDNYGKKVMVAETSYAYTLEEGDGHGNSVGEADLNKNYAATVQSQATAIRDVMATVAKVGENALGVFYWEPAWIPVEVVDWNSDNWQATVDSNKLKWEEFGSGWASSYASTFDKDDAGQYYGGSSWDNQAMFDFWGHPLPSLNVFKWVKYGTECDLKVDFVNDIELKVNVGTELVMPETVDVVYNDRSKNGPAKVTWDAAQVAAIDTSVMAEHNVVGTLEDGSIVNCHVAVEFVNYVENGSFEEKDTSMWNVIYETANPTDYQVKETDAYTGTTALHFYSTEEVYFQLEQTITGLEDGNYYFSLKAQGGDVGKQAVTYGYVKVGDQVYQADFSLTGWCVWDEAVIEEIPVTGGEVTVGVYCKTAAKGWGTIDDFYFALVQ